MVNFGEPLLNLITIVSFLVGLIGFYLIFSPVEFKRLYYFKKTYKVVDLCNGYIRNISSLYMICNEEKITTASITRIALWNSGTEDIYEEKIVKERPLILGVKEGSNARILNCSVYYRTDDYNMLKPEKYLGEDEKYKISFDYIEKKGGVILEIIHTGGAEDLYMDCYIKGGKGIIEIDKQDSEVRKPSNMPIKAQIMRLFKATANYYYYNENDPAGWQYGSRMLGMTILSLLGVIAAIVSITLDNGSAISSALVNVGIYTFIILSIVSIIGYFLPYRMPDELRMRLKFRRKDGRDCKDM